MVLPNVLCALNIASNLMLNGACCFYQMQEEEERRKQQEAAMQRTIRAELDLQRHQEMTQRHEQTIISHYQAQRRRKLMTQKQDVIAASMRDACVTELSSSQNRIPPPTATHTLHDPDFVPLHVSPPNAENGSTSSKTNCAKPEAGVKNPSSTPSSSTSHCDGGSKQYYNRGQDWASMSKQRSELSSLLDSDEEDNGNDLDVEELEEIMIE
jgi:hypothetical protein